MYEQHADVAKPRKRLSRAKLFWIIFMGVGIACGVAIGAVYGVRHADATPSSAAAAAPSPAMSTPVPTTTAPSTATSAKTAAAAAEPTPRLPILLIGDSNTEPGHNGGRDGWVTLLQNATKGQADVVNFGHSADNTTRCLLNILPPILDKITNNQSWTTGPALITVWYGANDAALKNGRLAGFHLPVEMFQANLMYILAMLRAKAPEATILLISPGVINDEKRVELNIQNGAKPGDPLDRTNEQAGIYAAASKQVAQQVALYDDNVEFLDFHTFFMDNYPVVTERNALLLDGLHFTKAGHQVVFHEIQKVVQKLMVKEGLVPTPSLTSSSSSSSSSSSMDGSV